jgi:hypothetical protein
MEYGTVASNKHCGIPTFTCHLEGENKKGFVRVSQQIPTGCTDMWPAKLRAKQASKTKDNVNTELVALRELQDCEAGSDLLASEEGMQDEDGIGFVAILRI